MHALRKYLNLNFRLNRHIRFIAIILWLFLCYYAHGQIKIEGTVIGGKSKTPIYGVNVILGNPNRNNVLSYSMTDDNGHYLVTCPVDTDSLQITLTSFDYEKATRVIPAISQTIDFELKEQPISLKEFSIKAPPIVQTGDTISYLVSDFSSESDRVIEDVLKKLPGIEVSESGKITYQGEAINKFYVENMDLLQGRYALATKNISVKDVATVEVFENHQPVKALSKSQPSDKAAINLKLKADAKGIISVMMQLGAGAASFLWDNELVSLYFSRKWQNINTYKGNNSGNDVTQEFTAFYSDAEPLFYEGRILSVLAPNPPPINKQRYLFNNTHAVSSNVLHALKNDHQLTANVVYYNDRQTKESYSRSTYYLPGDSSLIVEESLNNKTAVNHIATTIKWEANKETFYLNNAFNLNASWMDNTGVAATFDTIGQNLKTDLYNLSNRFELIKNFAGGKDIRFYSFNGYAQTPQNLLIKPALYADIVNNGEPFEELNQQTTFKDFSSKTDISFSIRKRRFTQSYWGGVDVTAQSLNSVLQPLQNTGIPTLSIPDSLHNDLLWQKYKVYIQPSYIYYPWQKLRIEAMLPLSYNILLINDKVPNKQQTINRILFNPNLIVIYNLAKNWSMKANYSYYSYLGNIQDSYTGYIMRNYRSFNRNDGQLAENKSNACFLRTSYRNVFQALFAHVDLFYEQYTSNMLKEQSYMGILQVQNSVRQSVTSDTYGIGGNISKNVYSWKTTFSLFGNYYDMFSSQMIQGELVDFRYINYGFKPKIESQICSWSGLSYTLFWNDSKNVLETSDAPLIRSISHIGKLYFYPVERLEIITGYENYYNNVVAKGKYKSFADVGVSYRFKWGDVSLTWSNIFNTNQYNTASYIDLNEFINIYEIRPSQILAKVKFKLI